MAADADVAGDEILSQNDERCQSCIEVGGICTEENQWLASLTAYVPNRPRKSYDGITSSVPDSKRGHCRRDPSANK
jgi:hypothetical protein